MNRNLRILFSLILITSCLSCKKSSNSIGISGSVYDPNQKIYVKGASVILQSSSVQGGVYNASYQNIATATTDASGKFSFNISFERVVGYKMIINKNNYFNSETDISGGAWAAGNTYYPLFNIYPIAYLKMNIKNTKPVDANDEIKYYIASPLVPCIGCCSDTIRTGDGTNYNAEYNCITQGGATTLIKWSFTKGGVNKAHDTSLYCKAFDTTSYILQY